MTRSIMNVEHGGDRHQAEIIPFARASRRPRREIDVTGAPLGKILLFTGVRYERMPEAAEPLPKRRRS